MPPGELTANIMAAFTALGFEEYASVQFGKWTALPRGSATPQRLALGDVVMIDSGVTCEEHRVDITRTVVFGKPTKRQVDVWNKELEAQTAAFNVIRIGRAVRGGGRRRPAGMCFSDGPMIGIPGEFGIRLEDDVYFGEDGPHFFSKQSFAIDQPFG